MSSKLFQSLFNRALTISSHYTNLRTVHTAPVVCAARRGTRAKARAKKVKVEVTKVGFIPHNQRGKKKVEVVRKNKHLDDSKGKIPQDDVYPLIFYRRQIYSAEDAIKAYQQSHHPTMFNKPDALVFAQVELNMVAVKKTRFLDNFSRLTLLPHSFPKDEARSILAFCKTPEMQQMAKDAGATTVGGKELIKKIQEGAIKLAEYDYVVAHPNILTELVPIRGLMKRKFPNIRTGTLDVNIVEIVKKFADGIQYRALKDEYQEDFGLVETPVGTLNMEPQQIASNIEALIKDIQSVRPKRDGLFITRCYITCPPSKEKLKIDPFVYVEPTIEKEKQEESDDEGDAVATATA